MPLLVAMALFSALYVVASVLTAAGKPRDALVLMAVMSIVLLVTLYQVVSSSPAGAELLERAAWSVLAVTAIAWLAASALVRWRLGVAMPWSTLARVIAAGALGVACAAQIGEEGFLLLGVRCALAGVVFLALLVVTGELGKRDLSILRATLQRGSS